MAKNHIRWKSRSLTAQGQRLYRSTQEIDIASLPPPIATFPITTEEYLDEDVLIGMTYYYMVSSFDGDVERFSDVISIDTGLPILGPGSQELMGNNDTDGFFGEVPVSELIDGTGLASFIGLTAGTAQNNTAPWLKFLLGGRILFIPKQTYRYNLSWDHINTVDAVFGDRVITIGGYQYRIGLLKGLGSDTSEFATGTYDNPATHGSEWNRLMYPISEELTNPVYHKNSQIGENWVSYTQNELNITTGNGRYSWCQETNPTNSGLRIYRGHIAVSYLHSSTSSNAGALYGWRPVLELVTA